MVPDRTKVLVAMSGGVDSSVAAGLLVRAGYDVTGVFMCLGSSGDHEGDGKGCCSPQDAADARRVADKLGIPLFVLNLQDEFGAIIDYFVGEYARGRTPNPCVLCNAQIKFGRLIELADSQGAAYVASGHYARIMGTAIARGVCIAKDQSYALFGISAERVARMLLPIGEIADKAAVRELARDMGLPVHSKPDSQEICFVPDDDYVRLLRERCPQALRAGDVVDSSGRVLGRHEGFAAYTIGQRKGLRIAGPVPMYVTRIDAETATVTLGPREATLGLRLAASGANWQCPPPGASFEAIVQIRYNNRGAPARVTITGDKTFDVEFREPVAAITPGQAAVVYDGERMLGGGWID